MSNRATFYNTIASDFDEVMNSYEVQKRLRLVFESLLPDPVAGVRVLDAGCGTGRFTQELAQRGAITFSLDIGHELLKQVALKHEMAYLTQSDLQQIGLASNSFDVIVCTEAIEHTPNPRQSVAELLRVLKPGGILALTVPNRIWNFSVTIADWLHVRPYNGYENWVSRRDLSTWVAESNGTIEKMIGFNLLPLFYKPFYPLLDFADHRLSWSQPFMVNIGIRVRKGRTA